jgi:hypothetical protein
VTGQSDAGGLLLVRFDDLRTANLCLVAVTPKLSQGSTLAQQVPTPVEFNPCLSLLSGLLWILTPPRRAANFDGVAMVEKPADAQPSRNSS